MPDGGLAVHVRGPGDRDPLRGETQRYLLLHPAGPLQSRLPRRSEVNVEQRHGGETDRAGHPTAPVQV